MRFGVALVATLLELALLVMATSVKAANVEGTHHAVFDLDNLVDDADSFAKGASVPSAAQTVLQRVERMKAALTQKILNKEIEKLPYSEKELGEGMAVSAVKDEASESYDQFKTMAKAIENQKAAVEKKMAKIAAEKVELEKKELKARKEAAELRGKVRSAVKKEVPEGQTELVGKLKDKVKEYKGTVEDLKKNLKDTEDSSKKEVNKIRDYFAKARKKRKEEITAARTDELNDLRDFKKSLESRWYVNSTQINEYKKKLQHAEFRIKDLEQTVIDNDKSFKQMESGLKAKFEAQERDIIRGEEKKLQGAKGEAAGEKQKEQWDRTKVASAEKTAADENEAMAEAVKSNKALQDGKDNAEKELSDVEDDKDREKETAENAEEGLKLARDLEEVGEDNANMQVNATKAASERETAAVTAEAHQKIKEANVKLKKKTEEMTRKLESLKGKYDAAERLQKGKTQMKVSEEQSEADKEINDEADKQHTAEASEQTAQQKVGDLQEKLDIMKEELERSKLKSKDLEEAMAKQEKNYKDLAAKDTERITKRAGARTEAAAEAQEVESADTKLAQKEAALQAALKRADDLSKNKDTIQKSADKFEQKFKESEYTISVHQKKVRDLELKLEKAELNLKTIKEQAGNDKELGEAQLDDQGRMEKRYKFEVKKAEAMKVQIALEQSKNAVGFTRSQKWEAKAQKFKQAMYAAEQHARRIAARVRKKWAMKLINEQDKHTKHLLKLKHLIALRQTKHDAEILKIQTKEESAQRSADKFKAKSGNQGEITKYIAGLVAEQAVRGRVLRKYMVNMDKIRKKYNKKLGKEWTDEIKRLQGQLKAYKNGKVIAGLKYKIMKLKSEKKAAGNQKRVKIEVKRSQELDIQTLLGAAIKQATKGSEHRSADENRRRVDVAVASVVNTVKAADDKKGKALAQNALAHEEEEFETPVDRNPASMQNTIKHLAKENRELRERLARAGTKTGALVESNAEPKQQATPKKKLTRKQQKLLGKLDNLLKMSGLPKKNLKIESDSQPQHEVELPKPPADDTMKTEQSSAGGSAGEADELGELRKGAFLVPAEDRELQD